MRNWDMDRLPSAMLDHAAADAFVVFDLLATIMGDMDQHRQQQVRQRGHNAVEKERWEEKEQKQPRCIHAGNLGTDMTMPEEVQALFRSWDSSRSSPTSTNTSLIGTRNVH